MTWGYDVHTTQEVVLMQDDVTVAVFDDTELAERVAAFLNAEEAAQREADEKARIAASAKGEAVVDVYPAANPEYWGVFLVHGGVKPSDPTLTFLYTDDGRDRAQRAADGYNS